MLGEGLPVAIQNRFVSKDSLTVRFPLEETISGGSVKGNKKVVINDCCCAVVFSFISPSNVYNSQLT